MSRLGKVVMLSLLVVAAGLMVSFVLLSRVSRSRVHCLSLQNVYKSVGGYKCEFVFANKTNDSKYLIGGEQPSLVFYIKQGDQWVRGYSSGGKMSNYGKLKVAASGECRFFVLMPEDIRTTIFYAEVFQYDLETNLECRAISSPKYRLSEGNGDS